MTLAEFEKLLDRLPFDDYVVRIRQKSDWEEEYEEFNTILFTEDGKWIWYTDWNEGQQDVQILWFVAVDDVKPSQNQWIPCGERLPSENGNYLVTAIWKGKAEVDMDYFQFLCQWDDYKDTVIAWMPLPKPYMEGEKEGCHTFGYTSPTNG